MSGSFLAIAGFFVMLNAPALAAFQVLIYVGAVTVVILFGIMFTQRPQVRRFRTIINRQTVVWYVGATARGVQAYVVGIQPRVGTGPGSGPREVTRTGRDTARVYGAPPIFGCSSR
jgi:NADH:ubiquinone oxidoreductase subunit 6 (subunit J)